jgi:hypothetical protein
MAFKPRKSGNPSDRPPKIATTQALRDELMPDMPKIIGVLKQQAREVDLGRIKLLLDRCYPALKSQTLSVSIAMGENLPETGSNILQARLRGGAYTRCWETIARSLNRKCQD